MRRLPICVDVQILAMTTNQNLEACSESRIERMKKLLSSPLTKKKTSAHGKMFGTALETLVHRETQQGFVPFIIVRICQYIEKHGMTHEGVFRISGNARLVEKLKSSFDHSGDAPLETEGDVASAGALLKLFLRELPDPVIPAAAQASFLEAVRANVQDKEKCVHMLKCLVGHLPQEHYEVLKYLMRFLHCIAQLEEQNRMSASSLGIVFAPNLFRVSDDFIGLKDQAVTNQITMTFIKNYSTIFEENNSNDITDDKYESLKSVTQPLSVVIPPMDDQSLGFESHQNGQALEKQVPVLMVDSCCDLSHQNSNEDHFYGKVVPSSLVKSIATPPRRKRKERKFSGEDAVIRSNSEERPVIQDEDDTTILVSNSSERMRRCSSHEDMRKMDNGTVVPTTIQQARRKSSAEVFGVNLTLSAGRFVLATHNQDLSPHPPKPKRRELENLTPQIKTLLEKAETPPFLLATSEPSDFHELQRSAERLMPHSQPTRSRRSSSKSSRFRRSPSLESEDCSKSSDSVVPMETRYKEKESGKLHDSSKETFQQPSSVDHRDVDRNFNYSRPQDLEQFEGDDDWQSEMFTSCDSDDVIPQLDFSAMHQHGDGNEPLLSQHRFSWPLVKPTHEETALLSPSAPFMRKTNSLQFDPSMPPSPPVEQEDVLKSVVKDELSTTSLKQLTKKMHSLKKKIKQFEESFEYEHGFRPSHAEKMNYPEIKKLLLDFNKARKEFRQLKEECYVDEIWSSTKNQSKYLNGICLNGDEHGIPSVEESLSRAQQYLSENRRQNQRPENFDEMTGDEIHNEKIAMQKALLQFESVHGRPSSKLDRDLMRPLYERYRKVKRIARSSAGGSNSLTTASGSGLKGKDLVVIGTELQPILEHEAMDFTSPQHRRMSDENQKVPDISEDILEDQDTLQEEQDSQLECQDCSPRKSNMSLSSNLHELPLSDLIRQLQQARMEKRRLKRSVRDFEEEFQRQTGRRAQKEDRSPVETLYTDYRNIKARLKLLEALVSKHEHHVI